MDPATLWQPVLTSLLSLFAGGGGVAWYTARQSRLARVSGDEREARRDMVSDRDRFIDRLEGRLAAVEGRLDESEADNAALRGHVTDYSDHIDLLEAHIWSGQAPPPPPRPKLL